MKYYKHFQNLKKWTEYLWSNIEIDHKIYGFQVQKETKWNKGLSREELIEFEKNIGFKFPEILLDYYKVMNGTDKDQINVYGNSGEDYSYKKLIYSFPDHVEEIKNLIQGIYYENCIDEIKIEKNDISRIFPIFSHRFMLLDHPQHPILSMFGTDIIIYANNIFDLFRKDFGKKSKTVNNDIEIKFWLD